MGQDEALALDLESAAAWDALTADLALVETGASGHWRWTADKCRVDIAVTAPVDGRLRLCLKGDDKGTLFALVERIARLTPVRLAARTPADAAKASDKAERIALDRDMTTAQAFAAVVRSCLDHYRHNEDRLLQADTAEALHQARVALRRLRSALVAFRPLVDGARARAFNADLRWLTERLGAARNTDVLLPLAGEDADARAALLARRAEAYSDVHRALRTQLVRTLPLEMARWAATGGWRDRRGTGNLRNGPARDFARDAIGRLHARLLKQGHHVTGADDERRHALRKTGKKLRYTVEFFAALFDGKDGRKGERKARIRYLAALEELQDQLGALNDLSILPETLAALGVETNTGAGTGHRDFLILRAGEAMAAVEAAERFWE